MTTRRRVFHREPEEVRRSALISATLDAVAELGLPGATVREVSKRAEVTPGLIRRYFLSKDRLMEAAYAAFVEEVTGAAAGQVGDGPPRARLAGLVRASCREPVASKRHIAIWSAFIGAANIDAGMARIHREGYRAFRLLLEEIIADLHAEAGSPASPAIIHRQAIAANAVIDGIWLEVSLEGDAFSHIDVVDLALDSILAILGLPRGQGDAP
ncbi:MAG: TetR family transcriptional regulator C-terminal domain-containing protein [Pseudomonadota bacterium]